MSCQSKTIFLMGFILACIIFLDLFKTSVEMFIGGSIEPIALSPAPVQYKGIPIDSSPIGPLTYLGPNVYKKSNYYGIGSWGNHYDTGYYQRTDNALIDYNV